MAVVKVLHIQWMWIKPIDQPLYTTESRLRKDTMYVNKVTDKEHKMAVDKATRSVTGAECLKVVGENRADQIRAKKAVKDMKNLANVTHSVKQLSLTERTVARGDMSSKVKGKKTAHPAKSTRIGGKFSRSNDGSKAQRVPVESVRKVRRVNIYMPLVPKAEKIRLQKAFLEKVVSCPVSEAYLECLYRPGMFKAKLTDEEILKLRGMEEVISVIDGVPFIMLE